MGLAVAMLTGFLAWGEFTFNYTDFVILFPVSSNQLKLVIDTKVLIGGGRYELSPDQYIEAVCLLYYDIVYIFYYLLLIFARD